MISRGPSQPTCHSWQALLSHTGGCGCGPDRGYYEKAAREYESARRIADAGGPLPPIEAATLGEVSDPDANNSVSVTTYRYEDRYWWPRAR